ncbi:hypothetical protein HQ586_08415 [Candidatus Bathyarchaeota archaeon]|nr:hypothetical protein [Candidatus Bathyarchaeota archaeon]
MSSIIEKVETFIQRLYDLDYVINQRASELTYTDENDQISLAHILSKRIVEYERVKDDEEKRLGYATICHIWITKAFTYRVVEEGQGLARKLKECLDRNAQLESDLEKLSLDYLALQELTRRIGLPDERDLEKQK